MTTNDVYKKMFDMGFDLYISSENESGTHYGNKYPWQIFNRSKYEKISEGVSYSQIDAIWDAYKALLILERIN